jgi:hypothetical protein
MTEPIQTRYAGYLFRSRLEARWAVFFDALGLRWEYEPEGFVLPSGEKYLPDFCIHLRHGPLWIEIKPLGVGSHKMEEFIHHQPTGDAATILHEIPDPRYVKENYPMGYWPGNTDEPCIWWPKSEHAEAVFKPSSSGMGHRSDNCYRFCICPKCGEVGFEFDGTSARIGCGCQVDGRPVKGYFSQLLLPRAVQGLSRRIARRGD